MWELSAHFIEIPAEFPESREFLPRLVSSRLYAQPSSFLECLLGAVRP